MPEDQSPRARCLWHADDGRCSSCKARRIRADVLKLKDYDVCCPERDYPSCDFYAERPAVPRKR
ncbi:hypothetical protein [Methanomassiliicoccus luminyensis]|jgi:hypothetical protein|uniref:hypothetical protein n=1 Tax=Methanomassiliicoccus luminyensis TaxID=1080712 RepID=UPI00037698A4|nr:hypothetical protein [Methanomassiliicoccus luminyensis]